MTTVWQRLSYSLRLTALASIFLLAATSQLQAAGGTLQFIPHADPLPVGYCQRVGLVSGRTLE
jgi:hypothetical protein